MKVREDNRVVGVAVMIATGVNADGYREKLGWHLSTSESHAGWLELFRDMTAEGLSGVQRVTSDAHDGLKQAVAATLPGAARQRCRTRFSNNLQQTCSKTAWGLGESLDAVSV